MVIVDKENNSNPRWSVLRNNLSSSERAEKAFVEIHFRWVYNTQSRLSVNPSCFRCCHFPKGPFWAKKKEQQLKSIFFISRHLRQENMVMEKDVSKEETHSPLPPCRSCQEALTGTGPWTCVCSSRWDRSQKAEAWLKCKKKKKRHYMSTLAAKERFYISG